ncbi:MAG: hypothetical protein IKT46_07110, partial [Clostridia bacterium]|nr:hypothetical protein [Clostridia bacterium]
GFSADGLQLTVSNLDNVKVIRTAYGEHKTVSAIKKAKAQEPSPQRTTSRALTPTRSSTDTTVW